MAELTIRPEEIRDALANFVKSYDPGVAARDEIGTVTEAGDGIARIEGLPSTMTNELLKFENGTLGLALNLDVRGIELDLNEGDQQSSSSLQSVQIHLHEIPKYLR